LVTVRAATADGDAQACAAVYAPYVTDTAVTFESQPPTAAEMAERIAAAAHRHAWLVLEDNGRVVGFAYAGPYKLRPAYRGPARSASTWSAGGGAPAVAGCCTRRCSPGWPSAASAPPSPA